MNTGHTFQNGRVYIQYGSAYELPMQTISYALREMYLDYFNNFISTQGFADHYEITRETALDIIKAAKEAGI